MVSYNDGGFLYFYCAFCKLSLNIANNSVSNTFSSYMAESFILSTTASGGGFMKIEAANINATITDSNF